MAAATWSLEARGADPAQWLVDRSLPIASEGLDSLGVTALAAFGFGWLLLSSARALGWLDPRPGTQSARKPQIPAAPVGGVALVLAWAAALLYSQLQGAGSSPWLFEATGAAALSLLLALLLGSLDDLKRGGLAPLAKLLGQALAAAPLGYLAWTQGYLGVAGGAPALGLALLTALAAMNLVNTWDNADGAALCLGLLAGLPSLLGLSAGCAGLLPWNLRRPRLAAALPQLYLGDAGSHLVGMALALHPASLPALWVPLLDLVRLSIERTRQGSRPWIGDRSHLAHRLQVCGFGRGWSLILLCLAVAPSALLPVAWGLPLSTLIYAVLVWRLPSGRGADH